MPRIPMLFPGQASQSVGMAADLLAAGGTAAEFLRSVNDLVGIDLVGIMTAGPAEILTETRNAQPAILAHSVAVTLALGDLGVLPSIVAGHSLGEFSAAVACSALCPEDAVRTVRRRGELMWTAGQEIPGTMAAVMGLSGAQVAEVCAGIDGVVVPANHNSDNQVVISGEIAAVAAAGEALKAAGAKRVAPLNVSGAFHSPLLEGAATAFRAFLDSIAVHDPAVPLVANVSAEPVTAAAALREGFARQLTAPVLWHDTMERICGGDHRPRVVLEVGPGKVLTGLARRAYPDVTFVPVGTVEDLEGLPAVLAAHAG
ncbi:MAG TPA: ACP S-malonyltransferase [Candidatus Krumholzibacteria bacterium]|nr:ACP S-malonyltransferase [Candidatus Krumholzibacteria bacterium]